MNLVFLCAAKDRPIGGIKVIHQMAAAANAILAPEGGGAFICHPNHPFFRISWFKANVRYRRAIFSPRLRPKPGLTKIRSGLFDPRSDIVVLPELWVRKYALQLKALGVPYVILVQAGYFIGKGEPESLRRAYGAAHAIWCVSDDTVDCVRLAYPDAAERVHRFHVSVDADRFRPILPKQNWITYLPSKMPRHAELLRLFAGPHLPPGWEWKPLAGLSESAFAEMIGQSKIFVALAELEGFGLPPIEAALAGNVVLGYHGQGGREYWDSPVFTDVRQGDLPRLARAVVELAQRLSQGPSDEFIATTQRGQLAQRYAPSAMARDISSLTNILSRKR